MNQYRLFAVLALVALIIGSCGRKTPESSQTPAAGTPAVETPAAEEPMAKFGSRVVKGWMTGLINLHPGMDARKGVSLGEGALSVKSTPSTAAWFEVADVDSNGTPEKVGFMWDDARKVMYAYTHDPVTLDDGTMADKGLVVAQFAEGNTTDRPKGSGFWAYATERDTLSGRLMKGALFGCRFDPSGKVTACGRGTWSRDNNTFTIRTTVK